MNLTLLNTLQYHDLVQTHPWYYICSGIVYVISSYLIFGRCKSSPIHTMPNNQAILQIYGSWKITLLFFSTFWCAYIWIIIYLPHTNMIVVWFYLLTLSILTILSIYRFSRPIFTFTPQSFEHCDRFISSKPYRVCWQEITQIQFIDYSHLPKKEQEPPYIILTVHTNPKCSTPYTRRSHRHYIYSSLFFPCEMKDLATALQRWHEHYKNRPTQPL